MSVRKGMLRRHYKRICKPGDLRTLNKIFFQNQVSFPPICCDITGATRWFCEESGKDYWYYEKDFPNCVSPWPVAWYESSLANGISFPRHPEYNIPPKTSRADGFLVFTEKIPDDMRQEAFDLDLLVHFYHHLVIEVPHKDELLLARNRIIQEYQKVGRTPKWISLIFKSVESWNKLLTNSEVIFCYLDDKGIPLARLFIGEELVGYRRYPVNSTILFPLFFSISLMSCKNVYLVDSHPPVPRSRKERKQKKPAITYRTIVIDPLRKQAKREAVGTKNTSVKQALHIVRGHFKDFRDGKGLFGKYKDIYWWDMQVRGDAQFGRVEKDYKVKGKGAR